MGKSKKKIEKKTRTPKNFSREKLFPPEVFFQNSEDKKTPHRRLTFDFPRQKSLKPPENQSTKQPFLVQSRNAPPHKRPDAEDRTTFLSCDWPIRILLPFSGRCSGHVCGTVAPPITTLLFSEPEQSKSSRSNKQSTRVVFCCRVTFRI